MIMNQGWLAELFELQRKAAELSRGGNPTAEVQNMVLDLLKRWGLDGSFWNGAPAAGFPFQAGHEPERRNEAPSGDVEIRETQGTVRVQTVIPGIAQPGDLRLELQGNLLSLSGSSGQSGADSNGFSRMIRLPAAVTAAGATAVYEAGQLTVTLPKLVPENGAIPLDRFVPGG
jgi:HSP20 family molecular chaperone IbpA